jgi:cytochrome oxidase Cu insertion factor (SCO1/SenC/PrrC family)
MSTPHSSRGRRRRSSAAPRFPAVASLTAVALLAVLLPAAAARAVGQVGDQAGDFSLTDSQGQMHTLAQYDGKVLLLFMAGYG